MTLTIPASQWCSSSVDGCIANEILSLTLINAKNPNYISSSLTTSVEITTQNQINGEFLTIDELKEGISFANNLVPGVLSQSTLTRGGSLLTGGVPTYTFTIKTATPLPQGSGIRVTFPIETAYFDTSSVTCRIGSVNTLCTSTALATDNS